MRVRFRAQARSDLAAIRRWIARDDPVRAKSFVRELRAKAESLADFSRRGEVVYQTPLGSVHKVLHREYLIHYRVLSDRVEVIGIHHGRRSPASRAD